MTDLIRQSYKCDNQKVVYRYLPRTFEMDQENPQMVTDIFRTMFSQPSPWVNSVNTYDERKYEEINKYFISQA